MTLLPINLASLIASYMFHLSRKAGLNNPEKTKFNGFKIQRSFQRSCVAAVIGLVCVMCVISQVQK